MPILKRVLLVPASMAATLFLIFTAIDAGVVRVVGSPDPIKKTLADSGIYGSLIPSLLDQAEKKPSPATDVIPFNHEIVRSAALTTFSGDYLQSSSNTIIDSIYRWMEGQTPQPDFTIDLSAKKTELANKVADGVQARVAALPRCTKAPSSDFNGFTADCRPSAITPTQAASVVREELLNSQDFMSDTVIAANEVKGESGQPLFTGAFKDLPDYYQKFKASPAVLAAIGFLLLAAVFFLSTTRLGGLKHVSFILIGSGVFLLVFTLGVNEALDNKVIPQISLENAALQDNLRQLAGDMAGRISNSFMVFGAAYSALGALGIGLYYYLQRQRKAKPKTTRSV